MTSILLLSRENDYVEIQTAIGESSSNILGPKSYVIGHVVLQTMRKHQVKRSKCAPSGDRCNWAGHREDWSDARECRVRIGHASDCRTWVGVVRITISSMSWDIRLKVRECHDTYSNDSKNVRYLKHREADAMMCEGVRRWSDARELSECMSENVLSISVFIGEGVNCAMSELLMRWLKV
ncbi:uncharacterized protein EDB93DRAFT_1109920 [Suillus bovinus]|uniref:uncharacterized protein n=1 Tax=Suillus bovinus TaxID=48563 RepID=UPI001B87C9AA|nr:uncharacterized protein EDB93DRAFT_1109920 [Suillus bovinus]KAG2125998.1 hypothetical protein EDB93DRAFT_1109920 [Suillus bovinus]